MDQPIADTLEAAISHHQAGRLSDAERLYRSVLEADGRHPTANHNLGLLIVRSGRLEEALPYFWQALEADTSQEQFWIDYIAMLAEAGHTGTASNVLNHARQLGLTGPLADELSARVELAVAWVERYRTAEAHAEAGSYEEALAEYEAALALKPDATIAQHGLITLLRTAGRGDDALRRCLWALRLNETWAIKWQFTTTLSRASLAAHDADISATLARALTEGWTRPEILSRVAALLLGLHPEIGGCMSRSSAAWPEPLPPNELFGDGGLHALASDPLFRAYLVSTPITDIQLEWFVTMARQVLLGMAIGKERCGAPESELLEVHCILAQQCFINEYVFHWMPDEEDQARKLRDSMIAALDSGENIPAPWLVAVASYFPLNSLPSASRLLDRRWPEAVEAVLTQQIREPEEERSYRETIPRLTPIEHEVSRLVEQQYAENPYPVWVRPDNSIWPVDVDDAMRSDFPHAPYMPLGKEGVVDILVAGCGTGQHPIETARRSARSRVLAVDLSLSSLCYAKRKTVALGLTSITYAQADILALGGLNRTFDIIESAGVLHHLADPFAGWSVLLDVLRPGGVLHLGLYSRLARQDIARGRAFVTENQYDGTAESIRTCRQHLIADFHIEDAISYLRKGDFFSTSACRDLLFHVQEHCLSLDEIGDFIARRGLHFLGFNVTAQVAEAYHRRFPDDPTATDLRNWHAFETDNPSTFRQMYQFCVQKPLADPVE